MNINIKNCEVETLREDRIKQITEEHQEWREFANSVPEKCERCGSESIDWDSNGNIYKCQNCEFVGV